MAFPETVLPLVVELYVGGTWVDLTALGHVYRRDMANISRGRADEAAQVDRSTATLTLNNRDGRYSPRNPTGPYYGQLARNTPIRIAVERGPTYLALPGGDGDEATCPDSVATSVTGDIDIRIDVRLDDWRDIADLAAKFKVTGNQRSWAFYMEGGLLTLVWSANGTATITKTATALIPVPASGRLALRVTLDVNNGAAGNTVTFYTAPDISGSWTQLGDAVVTAGTTSIFNSTAVMEVGDITDLPGGGTIGRCYAFQLRNGIGGTVVANPDFTIQTAGASSVADTASSPNTWTIAGGAEISNRHYRFHGEVSSWPPRWDLTGRDVYVPVEASGVLRRLTQGSSILGSALYRGRIFDTAGLVAYWPFEDAEGSTSMAPALNHGAMSITGSPEFASFDAFVASHPIVTLNGAELRGPVPQYTDTGLTQIRFLMAVPAGGAEDGQVVVMFYGTGTVRRWEVFYGTGGTLGLRAFDGVGGSLFTSGAISFGVNGELLLVSVELTQNGANIDWNLLTLEPGAVSGLSTSGTLAANTVGRTGTITVSPAGGIADVAIGHVSLQNAVTTLFDLGPQLEAWAGERAGRRVQRLCREEGIAFRPIGDLDDSTRMGVQRPNPLITLIREAAAADDGVLFEPRDMLGLGYRTRASLYNQVPALALDYEAHELAEAPSPVDDDQNVRNDVTVTREGGSSARTVLETGPLSVLVPPAGVGRYDAEVTVNVEYDLDLFDQAGWRLHLGTVDEARYPTISINLAHPSFAGDATQTEDAHELEVGDRLTIANPPSWLPPEDISQLAQGYAEELGNYEHTLVINCSPESPYQVAAYDSDRYGPHSSTLAEDLTTTETGADVATTVGPLWTTSGAEFPFDVMIGGERMTVTAISGSSSPQTLTVVRSVNGVVKTHSTGAAVQLFRPAIYAL